MSEKTALAKPEKNIFAILEGSGFKDQVARALPTALSPDRVIRLALTMLRKSHSLQRCTPESIMASVVEASQLGLELEGVLGHAYLVPFKDECTLIIGYRGFMELMYRSAAITAVSAEIVRKADVFRVQFGTDRRILHRPQPAPVKDGPDNWRGVYAVAKLLHGEPDFEYLSREKVEEARSRSNSWRKFKSDGVPTPWSTDPEEMWRKTAIRRLAKRMPKNSSDKRSELLRAVILDEYGERRLLKPTLGGFETLDEPEEEKEKPIEPTLEAQLQESIEDVEKRKAQVAAKNKPPTKSTKKIQPNAADNQVPKAAIPPESKIDDPYLTGKQQTDVYNAALQAGWRVPEEITEYIKKTFKVNSIREVRNSQFAQLMRKAKGDEK